jgi:retinol dehydrogenase 12
MNPMPDMKGKVCLITGATSGIGKVTAQELAQAGAAVVVVGRNPQRTAAVVEQIKNKTGSQQVDSLIADLSVQADVRRLAQEFRQRYDRLDVLVNNAGSFFMQRQTSQDGIELTFALNHLAYFLLTNLLLDVLIASAPARIINVSSGAHLGASARWSDLKDPPSYSGWRAYSASKLANIAFTYELARRLEGTGVTSNALHPGYVATNFALNNSTFLRPLLKLFQLAAITPEKGAETTIYLAASPEVEGVTGKYFYRCQPIASSRASYDEQAARKLWELSLEWSGLSA